jgi:GNAT superfamily N-acetyltransferase
VRRLRRVEAEGITLRPIDDDRFKEELLQIYQLSLAGFRRNFLYSPLDQSEFMEMYLPMRRFICREIVLLAEKQGKLVGFVFCVPDHLQALRGRTTDTAVLKTFAVHPDFSGRGIGSVLVTEARNAAAALGYRKLVIAFMHEDNPSLRISAHYATEIRRYALFARRLVPHEDH